MTRSQQYDQQKHETADRYREMDAVDEVLHDIKSLRGSSVDEETLEDLIEQIEEYVHYEESLEYILRQIPNKVKDLLVE
jgi:5'-deoxynucleotidase YfbR-like HD superfamily hydrolase